MDMFQALQGLLGQGQAGGGGMAGVGGMGARSGGGADMLSGLMNPAVLGGIASALFGGKGGMGGGMGGMADGIGGLLGALFSGGGAMADDRQVNRMVEANRDVPQYGRTAAKPEARAARLLRALVFAAKADGHIDADEQAAINDQLDKLNLGPEGRTLIQQAIDAPLDPNLVAQGVADGQEAIQLYALSAAVTNADQFMEKSYLDALATALRIPADVKTAVEAKIRGGR